MKKLLIALIGLMVLAGCASVPKGDAQQDLALKQFKAPAEKAGLYVYRNENFGAAIKMNVLLDNKQLGDTAAKTYLYTEVAPGKHQLVSKSETDSVLDFDAVAGKIYYVWQEIKMGTWSAGSKLQMMGEAEGKKGVSESSLAVTVQQ
ncbi:uncharacterized protein YceK [Silvimonas terrae]|uniref:Uncharacterized protein YceK n=1 Tax=Silvimonas terrae TaxID=300266 RepID=A0A840RDC2_9NEIS|nr:DUF2846 domain-containing protein [Silvimonas terrae]MBB5190584.1 uncharacterized protein YceK [Silvimonas terrae]